MAENLPVTTLATAWMASHPGEKFTAPMLADIIGADKATMVSVLKRLHDTGYRGLVKVRKAAGAIPGEWVYDPARPQGVPSSALVPVQSAPAGELKAGDQLEVLGRTAKGTVLVREASGRLERIWALAELREAE